MTPAGHVLLAAPVLAGTCWAQLRIVARAVPLDARSQLPAVYRLIAELAAWCAVTVAAAACVGRSRHAGLGGAISAPVSFAAVALAWSAPLTGRFLVTPPATARGATVAWYAVASAAPVVTCVAMPDRWHRHARALQRLGSAKRWR